MFLKRTDIFRVVFKQFRRGFGQGDEVEAIGERVGPSRETFGAAMSSRQGVPDRACQLVDRLVPPIATRFPFRNERTIDFARSLRSVLAFEPRGSQRSTSAVRGGVARPGSFQERREDEGIKIDAFFISLGDKQGMKRESALGLP